MITYLYWLLLIGLIFAIFFGLGAYKGWWKPATIISLVLLLIGTGTYYFYFEQMFVKRWGGTMGVNIPDGHQHMQTTWKGDNLWIQNYNPEKNECIFGEYSRGSMLEGKVVIKNCNPAMLNTTVQPSQKSAPTQHLRDEHSTE
ncbi:MAG TPA: hypothetical protein VK099_03850 [Alcanivoracaceae bacterium]|nr:hypothetical protein [Alcanivoracaceae bacterium]